MGQIYVKIMTAHCAFTPRQSDIKKTTKKKRKREVYGGLLLFCFAKLYIGHLSFWPISKHKVIKFLMKSYYIFKPMSTGCWKRWAGKYGGSIQADWQILLGGIIAQFSGLWWRKSNSSGTSLNWSASRKKLNLLNYLLCCWASDFFLFVSTIM